MQIVDFSFVTALAAPRHLLAGNDIREALVAATADGESTLTTSHHADHAYGLMLAEFDRCRSRHGSPQETRAAALGMLDLEWV